MIPAKQFDLCPWGKLNALPHMGWQHAGWFASYVVAAKNILEWGCGGSTLWMAMMKDGGTVVSVEHLQEWYDKVLGACERMGSGFTTPGLLRSAIALHLYKQDEYAANEDVTYYAPYDLIFVDGIERPACLAASYDLLLPGGVVFLHDSQRPEYTDAKRMLLEREGMILIDERVDDSWVNTTAGMWAVQKS